LLRGEYKASAESANRQLTKEKKEDAETEQNIKIEAAKLHPFKQSKRAPFAHPFYWSPFVLIGNFK
jgi:CHAT domain-containing protein